MLARRLTARAPQQSTSLSGRETSLTSFLVRADRFTRLFRLLCFGVGRLFYLRTHTYFSCIRSNLNNSLAQVSLPWVFWIFFIFGELVLADRKIPLMNSKPSYTGPTDPPSPNLPHSLTRAFHRYDLCSWSCHTQLEQTAILLGFTPP